jgi:hypothetical protein
MGSKRATQKIGGKTLKWIKKTSTMVKDEASGHRLPGCIWALAYVAGDCLLAWSWVIIPGGAGAQRAWHAGMVAVLVMACWGFFFFWTRRGFHTAFGVFLALPIAWYSLAAVDWSTLSLLAQDRPFRAWALANVMIGLAMATCAVRARGPDAHVSAGVLGFGAVYSWLGPAQMALCGPAGEPAILCAGLLGSQLRVVLTAVAIATFVLFLVRIVKLLVWRV